MKQYIKKYVLITGTTRGVGAQLAKLFLGKGVSVIGCGRSSATITHPLYSHYTVDISDENSVVQMFSEIRQKKIEIYLLINSAGLSKSSLGLYTSANIAESIIDVNLLGNFLVSRETLKVMYKFGSGRIINLSSINVPLASIGSSIYNATKAAIDALTRSLAQECRGLDITINTLGLSLVRNSGMYDELNEDALKIKKSLLIKPCEIDCDEICAAIDYFSSEAARNITGQILYFGGVR